MKMFGGPRENVFADPAVALNGPAIDIVDGVC